MMDLYNQTVYNKDLSIKYNRYFLFRFLLTRFSLLFVVVIVASFYLNIIHMGKYILVLWGIFAFNLLILLLVNMVTSSRTAKEFDKNQVSMEYHFNEDTFVVSQMNETTEKEVSYVELKKVVLTRDLLLGYFKKSPVPMIISKNGFRNQEDGENLFHFLSDKIKSLK
ncbi:MAG: hypothetical protein AB7U79_01610 [Candidatus Izemoplasmatales bacterium]